MGKRCQIRSGDQRCALFAGRPPMWCCRRGCAVLRRTQHFGGLKTPLGVTPSRSGLKRKLPSAFSAILLFVGSIGWCWPVFDELRSPVLVSPAEASIQPHISRCQRLNRCRGKADSEIGKLDPFRSSTYAPSANPHVTAHRDKLALALYRRHHVHWISRAYVVARALCGGAFIVSR